MTMFQRYIFNIIRGSKREGEKKRERVQGCGKDTVKSKELFFLDPQAKVGRGELFRLNGNSRQLANFKWILHRGIDTVFPSLVDSKDNTDNLDSDMVEESYVPRMKKDAYFVASSDGPGLIITTIQLKENDKDNNYTE
ncbi:hypothetical protein M9H77_07594 [Catharanthus roseus]|uniref:Uncharacterized protein n=1 Tax=Catharanthus roseus TaxID=4058 RepID=A0ACC0BVJ9_CATRO|nr:hypothetical protein M9H77_07594 [Catharanthus roseus]